MSLVNDALKRVSSPKARTVDTAVMLSMQPTHEVQRGAGPLPIVLFIAGIGALLVSGAFWLKSKGTPPQDLALTQTREVPAALTPVAQAEKASSVAQPTSVPENAPAPSLAAAITPVSKLAEPVAAHAEVTAVVPVTAPVEAPPPAVVQTAKTETPAQAETAATPAPELKLQAIYYRMKGPTVVINGKTLKVGDKVAGAKLITIERNAVEVEVRGARRKLMLL